MITNRGPVDLSRWKEYFIAHEIAHQWWGQGITWQTYHDHWLSEGLAQFSAVLYLKEKYGNRVFSDILKKFSQWTEKKSEWGPISLGSRLSYFDYDAYQTIIYNKTSLVLNMLIDLLGEGVFFRGLEEFFRKHQYGAASTNDFINTFKEISGKNLRTFFKNWFDSYTLPEVRVSHSFEKEDEGGYILKLRVTQLKESFIFPLLIEWEENGKQVTKRVIIDDRRKTFDFELGSKPKKIEIRRRGGGIKRRLLSSDFANVINPSNNTSKKVKIIKVLQNQANVDFQRKGVITKGAVIETPAGNAIVTSRPGQDGTINAVLVKKS